MRKFTFLMALVLIVSTINAQEIRRQSAQAELQGINKAGITAFQQGAVYSHCTEIDRTAEITRPTTSKSDRVSAPQRAPGNIILSQGFEGTTGSALPAGWEAYKDAPAAVTATFANWQTGTTNPRTGARAINTNMGFTAAAAGGQNVISVLWSPDFALQIGVTYEIELWYRWNTAGATHYPGVVISLFDETNNEVSEIFAGGFVGTSDLEQNTYTSIVATFTPTAANMDYYLEFWVQSSDPSGVFIIDDVLIKEAAASVNCAVTALPLVQDFEDDSYICWTTISNNAVNDWSGSSDFPMGLYYTNPAYTNTAFAFSSYAYATDYNQYLISPELPSNSGLTVTFDYFRVEEATELFRVGYSTTTNNVNAFTWGTQVSVTNNNINQYSLNAPAGTKYIAINYLSNFQYILLIDNIVINNVLAPTISSRIPNVGATNVPLNTEVSVTFNQNISGALTGITINGLPVTASIAGNKLTINNSALAYNTTYTVNIPANAVSGYAQAISWSFTTLADPGPALAVSFTTPVNNAANVALNTEVSVTFNQDIVGTLAGITINGLPVTASIDGSKLIVNHSNFAYGTTYIVNIPANAVSGYAQAIIWSFTTLADPGPALAVSFTTPANNATNVALNDEVSVTFNQDIVGTLAGITINGLPVTASIDGSKLIVNHSNFAYGTTYIVNIPANAVSGYAQAIIWSFTTAAESSIPVVNGNEINIFQNNGEINVVVSEKSDIRILDMLGRVLGKYNVAANATLKVYQPAGIYLLEVRSGGTVSTHKVILK